MPPRPLASVPPGDEILIDANVLIYGLSGSSAECAAFIKRCADADVQAFVTVDVLGDVCHKLMIVDAHLRGLVQRANASALQGKPGAVAQLSDYWNLIRSLKGMAILPLDEFRFTRAQSLRRQYGLMTNDSLLLAAAEVFGIESLATNDADFDAVPWLTAYKPGDVP